MTRRRLLAAVGAVTGGAIAGVAVTGVASAAGGAAGGGAAGGGAAGAPPTGSGAGPGRARPAGSLPDPTRPAGTDLVPEIERIVVVMMENHSFDNLLGMLGRGDGFRVVADGRPMAACPDGRGGLVRAFHMPSDCQTGGVSNAWDAGHVAYDHGTNQGFVEASSPEAMGYFVGSDVPFTWGLARTFPIADRWFSSVMGQTYPNRRYLLSGTSLGQVSDTYAVDLPPAGTVFDLLDRFGITWADYYSDLPSIGVYLPLLGRRSVTDRLFGVARFYEDAAGGRLPQFSLVEPNYTVQSEEDPQDIQYGDQFLADVVGAVLDGPQWPGTLLIWVYDEWGGWYDHVPPPVAVPPDDVAPDLPPGSQPGSFARYGFRVPAGVVSPYARRDYVSHIVRDHTSVLKTVERKWNLPALTRRDASVPDVLDMVDLRSPPAFLRPPALPAGADPGRSFACLGAPPPRLPPASARTAT
jgi:phospholipase C